MNVPKLRFKEFNDEWKEIKLKDYIKERKVKNGDLKTYPLWSLTIEDGVIPKTERYERSFLVKKNNNYKLSFPNDYVYNPMNAHLGAIARNKSNNIISVSGYYDIFEIDNKNYSFFDNYFISQIMFKKYNLISTGTLKEKQRVHLSQFKELNIKIPKNDKELNNISNFFFLLDKKIELQSKKIEDLKLYKMCISKKLFDNKNLTTTLLKNICNIKKGQQLNNEYLKVNGIYYMLNGGMLPSGYTDNYNTLENTISISEGGNSCGYVNFNREKFWSGGHCYTVEPININNEYLFQLLKYYEKAIMSLRVGSGLPNIQKKDLELFKVAIHTQDEQEDISIILCKIDLKIDLESKKLSNLESLKKGLMQNMFI